MGFTYLARESRACCGSTRFCICEIATMILFILLLGLITSQAWALPDVLRRPQEPLPTAASPSLKEASVQLSQLAEFALSVAIDHIGESHPPQQQDQCTEQNLRIRRNWRAFTPRQKKDFISSVLCLQRLPARTLADLAPGAKTRYDDIVATHINQTLEFHYTVHTSRCSIPTCANVDCVREPS